METVRAHTPIVLRRAFSLFEQQEQSPQMEGHIWGRKFGGIVHLSGWA